MDEAISRFDDDMPAPADVVCSIELAISLPDDNSCVADAAIDSTCPAVSARDVDIWVRPPIMRWSERTCASAPSDTSSVICTIAAAAAVICSASDATSRGFNVGPEPPALPFGLRRAIAAP